jgi:hypothetical protein
MGVRQRGGPADKDDTDGGLDTTTRHDTMTRHDDMTQQQQHNTT